MNDIQRLTALCADASLPIPDAVIPIAAAASSRRYYRMTFPSGPSLIGAIGNTVDENRAFVHIARCIEDVGLEAPRVVAVAPDMTAYIVSDLGDRQMMDAVAAAAAEGFPDDSEGVAALMRCMDSLPILQYGVGRRLDLSLCYPRAEMDHRSILWDLNHFKYCFLKAAGAEIDEEGLEGDFERLAEMVVVPEGDPLRGFIHRDCQSRNVMLAPDGTPQWIDFQGGRMGPVTYDVASMVWHARAAIPAPLRRRLVERYVAALVRTTGCQIDVTAFEERLRPVLLLRFLQVLGAYGLRGLTEGKAAFLTPIPALVDELLEMVEWMRGVGLCSLADTIAMIPQLAPVKEARTAMEPRDGLTVTVMSFSYKRGLPRDFSGHGGGFIFDCRFPDNPGRYKPYKTLTGMDRPVIDFIERDGELPAMVDRAIELVAPAIRRYQERGFTHLSVSFGCTGGQHRSVYSAERAARAFADMGVKVRLIHREQSIDRRL